MFDVWSLFEFGNHLAEEVRADYFNSMFYFSVGVCVMCLLIAVLFVGLWFVIVAFPGHTYIHFGLVLHIRPFILAFHLRHPMYRVIQMSDIY